MTFRVRGQAQIIDMISFMRRHFRQSEMGQALIIDIWFSGGAVTSLADGMGAPRPSLAPLK